MLSKDSVISRSRTSYVLEIIKFTLPIIFTNVLQQLYVIFDHMIVSKYGGDTLLAAIGATGYLSSLFTNLIIGVSVGASAIIAQSIGRQDEEVVQKSIHTAIGVGLAGGLLISLLGVIFCGPLLSLMKTPDNILADSTNYMRVTFIGYIVASLYNFGSAVLRAVGDTKKPLYFLSISGILKLGLNYLFVAVMGKGVAFVALATIISNAVAVVLVLFSLTKKKNEYKFYFRKVRIHPIECKAILKTGIPIGLQSSMFSIANILIQSSINSFGTIAIAGAAAAGHINSILYATLNSVSHSSTIYCSRDYGAKDFKRLKESLYICLGIVAAIGLISGGAFHIFKRDVIGLFVSGKEAIDYGDEIARVICLTYIFNGAMEVVSGGLRAINKSFHAMVSSVFGLCIFRIIWIYTYFAAHRSLEVLYYSYPLSWIITLIINTVIFVYCFSKIVKKEKMTELK